MTVGHEVNGPMEVLFAEFRKVLKSPDLRGKGQCSVFDGVIERLDTDRVADEVKLLFPCIEQGKGKHAVEAGKGGGAPMGESGKNDFGIATRFKGIAKGSEVPFQFRVVVDLAVIRNDIAAAGGDHGLVAGGAEVDEGKAAMAEDEGGVFVGIEAFVIRTAVAQGVAHGGNGALQLCNGFGWG